MQLNHVPFKNVIALFATFTLLALAVSIPARAGIKESWYLYRGRENMKIKNYKAAVEAYEQAIKLDPSNEEASRNLGLAYENQGIVDKAVTQFDSHLAKFPKDGEIALRQARLLKWDRYSYRQADAVKYYRMALESQPSPKVRLEFAEVLAAKKETSDNAITEFNKVLAQDPRNARAHKGLAKAYAWQGNQDQALYHSHLAEQYGDRDIDVQQLQKSIAKDRRPEAGADFLFLDQSSGVGFDLAGVRAGATGKFDVSPFLTLKILGGAESFWNTDEHAAGAYIGLTAQYRLSVQNRLDVDFTYHSMTDQGQEGKVEYSQDREQSTWKAGYLRELIYDSYLSLIGSDKTGQWLGAARKNTLFVEYQTHGLGMKVDLKPYLGWVNANSVSPNSMLGTDFTLTIPLGAEPKWSIVAQTEISHYDRDQSGFVNSTTGPQAGGYFSPSFFLSQFVLAKYERKVDEVNQIELVLGPAVQVVDDTNQNGTQAGGMFRGSYLAELNNSFFIKTEVTVLKLANVYTQTSVMAWATWKF